MSPHPPWFTSMQGPHTRAPYLLLLAPNFWQKLQVYQFYVTEFTARLLAVNKFFVSQIKREYMYEYLVYGCS